MMESKEYRKIIDTYFKSVCEAYSLGNIESTYYAPVCTLFNSIGCAARDLSGERKGQSGENIDIKLWHSEDEIAEIEPFAGIEVKAIDEIDKRACSQIITEVKHYGNAILTDNKEWRFWHAGDEKMYAGLTLIEEKNNVLVLKEEQIGLFFDLLKDFLLKDPAHIKSSTKLAEYMAMHARTIKSIIIGILRDNGSGQPLVDPSHELPMFPELYGLYRKIKSDLRPNLSTRDFADMYAQTIVYGLFIARYNDTTLDTFDKYEAIGNLQEESELLKQFFMHITGSGKKHPTLDSVVDKLCSLYRMCNISELLNENDTPQKDAIVHFYETFLQYYDPKLRKEMGVFYTPIQAVKYLINMVDIILIDDFRIENGLSNNDQLSFTVPCAPYRPTPQSKQRETVTIQVPRVAILDPACGTGSFGSEIIKYVKNKYFSGSKEAFYESYIEDKNGLISRLISFEIMMTSYVVAHLKIK